MTFAPYSAHHIIFTHLIAFADGEIPESSHGHHHISAPGVRNITTTSKFHFGGVIIRVLDKDLRWLQSTRSDDWLAFATPAGCVEANGRVCTGQVLTWWFVFFSSSLLGNFYAHPCQFSQEGPKFLRIVQLRCSLAVFVYHGQLQPRIPVMFEVLLCYVLSQLCFFFMIEIFFKSAFTSCCRVANMWSIFVITLWLRIFSENLDNVQEKDFYTNWDNYVDCLPTLVHGMRGIMCGVEAFYTRLLISNTYVSFVRLIWCCCVYSLTAVLLSSVLGH